MFVIGIDPGIGGGISGLDTEKKTLWSVETPVSPIDVKTKKREYDIPRIATLLRAAQPDLVCLESVHSMPHQGVISVFSFGKGFGILLGIIGTLDIPLKMVAPRTWKKTLGITADKTTAFNKATELFPNCSQFWKLKKHDGLAESALLAYYASSLRLSVGDRAYSQPLDLILPEDIYHLYCIEVNVHGRHRTATKTRKNCGRTRPLRM